MPEVFSNAASSTLATAIGSHSANSGVTFDVASASTFPTTGTFRVVINGEIFKVTGVSSNTFTATASPSDENNSTPRTHEVGSVVVHVATKGSLDLLANPPRFNVMAYGATGDGVTDDSADIALAIAAAKAAGGGTVWFPDGTFLAQQLSLPSHVVLDGTGELKHLNGTSSADIVKGEILSTTGTIAASSPTLTVASATGIEVGSLLAIRAAGGASTIQSSTLNGGVDSDDTTWTLASTTGFSNSQNYGIVDSEIFGWTGVSGSTLTGVTRGLFGTTAASHSNGATVAQAKMFFGEVTAVSGTTITLHTTATQSVTSANVQVGPLRAGVRNLRINGNRQASDNTSNPFPVNFQLARFCFVTNCSIINGDHGAVNLDMGARDNLVSGNECYDHGRGSLSLGAVIWLFRSCKRNRIIGNYCGGDSYFGIYLDDRTTTSTEYDGGCDDNLVSMNVVDIAPQAAGNSGVQLAGSSRNVVTNNVIRRIQNGVGMSESQGNPSSGVTQDNVISNNEIIDCVNGLFFDTSGVSWAYNNRITGATTRYTNSGSGTNLAYNNGTDSAAYLGILAPDGTAATPGIAFTADPDCGLFRNGANVVEMAINGSTQTRWASNIFKFKSTGVVEWSSTTSLAGTTDITLSREAASVLALGADDAFKTGKAVTGSRPSAATVGVGAQFFDTTLNIPIWSNGTVWKDAAGNTV